MRIARRTASRRPGDRARVGRRGPLAAGMTLVESLLAVAVLGMLVGVGMFAAEWVLPAAHVREAAGTLAATLQAARTQALTERAAVAVDFDAVDGRYATLRDGSEDELRLVELAPSVRFVHPAGQDAITLVPPDTTDTSALFSPRGQLLSASTPGFACLGDEAREVYMRVGVNVAGHVFVETWRGGGWE